MGHVPRRVPRFGKHRFRIGVARSEQVGHLVKFPGIEPLEECSYSVHGCCRLPEAPRMGRQAPLILLATVTVRADDEKPPGRVRLLRATGCWPSSSQAPNP